MNFLKICQELRNRAPGIGGSAGQPTSVKDQTGDMGNIVRWAGDAWVDIQAAKRDWLFMRAEFSETVQAGTADVSPASLGASDVSYWHIDTFRAYRPSVGVQEERYLIHWDYDVFRNTYRFGAQTPGLPSIFSVRPRDRYVMLGPVPVEDIVVAGEYQRKPQIMTENTDEPEGLPEEFHMLIVYRAMKKHAGFEAAAEIFADAMEQEKALWRRLLDDWLPGTTSGGTLA